MRLLFAISITALALNSCAGYAVSFRTPYGDVNSDKDGSTTFRLKPRVIVVPEK